MISSGLAVHVPRAYHALNELGSYFLFMKGETVSAIAKKFKTNRPKVDRTIDRALQVGALPSLDDLPRKGKPAKMGSLTSISSVEVGTLLFSHEFKQNSEKAVRIMTNLDKILDLMITSDVYLKVGND